MATNVLVHPLFSLNCSSLFARFDLSNVFTSFSFIIKHLNVLFKKLNKKCN
nr:MAG TPA: hypothetical protein [Caudoviricetes sp.]